MQSKVMMLVALIAVFGLGFVLPAYAAVTITETAFSASDGPRINALGDVDGDTNIDIVVTGLISQDISVLLGDGTGDFGASTEYSVGLNPGDIGLGDMNGDGDLDAVVMSGVASNDSFAVMLGDGTGGFSLGSTTTLAQTAGVLAALVASDIDGDGDGIPCESQFCGK